MKIKGISLVEQHIEKVVLLVAVVGLLLVAGWELVARPNRVQMDAKEVDPGQVDVVLKERADALAAKLRDDAKLDEDVLAQPAPRIASDFESSLGGRVSTTQNLPRLAAGVGKALLPIDLGSDTWYYEPKVPTAIILTEVVQTADALADAALTQHPELASRFSNAAAPKDIVWTTPAAVIDPKAIRDELRRADASATPPRVQVPTPWYNDSLYVLDVRFQREERKADGSWGDAVTVEPIPGQTSFRAKLGGQVDAGLRNELFAKLGDKVVQRQLLQPDFLPTRNNAFVPPSMPGVAAVKAGNEQADQIAGIVARLKDERKRKNDELTAIGGPLEDEPKDKGKGKDQGGGKDDKGATGGKGGDKGAAAPPSGGGGLSGGFSGPPKGGDKGDPNADKNKPRRIALTKAVKALDEKISRYDAELKTLAPNLKAEGGAASAGGIDLAGEQPLLVWAHDIGVQPGRTYRYRAVIDVYNPFFARKRQLVKEQAKISDAITMASVASDWSKPVEVTPPVAFFVTRASPAEGPLGLGTARIDVYRLHDGTWRKEEFLVSPGDRIGRVVDAGRVASTKEPSGKDAKDTKDSPKDGKESKETKEMAVATGPVDFSTDWYVVDIVEDQTAERRGGSDQKVGIVVLQKVGGEARVELRDPGHDMSSEHRKRLERDWKVGSLS